MPREFAFSVENLRPTEIVAWFSMHDGEEDLERLVDAVRLLRADASLAREFDAAYDSLLLEAGLGQRRPDGYLSGPPADISPDRIESGLEAISQGLDRLGFVDRTVATLKRAGWNAWRNCVGHVAVAPA